jgi:hypothetical protein
VDLKIHDARGEVWERMICGGSDGQRFRTTDNVAISLPKAISRTPPDYPVEGSADRRARAQRTKIRELFHWNAKNG